MITLHKTAKTSYDNQQMISVFYEYFSFPPFISTWWCALTLFYLWSKFWPEIIIELNFVKINSLTLLWQAGLMLIIFMIFTDFFHSFLYIFAFPIPFLSLNINVVVCKSFTASLNLCLSLEGSGPRLRRSWKYNMWTTFLLLKQDEAF